MEGSTNSTASFPAVNLNEEDSGYTGPIFIRPTNINSIYDPIPIQVHTFGEEYDEGEDMAEGYSGYYDDPIETVITNGPIDPSDPVDIIAYLYQGKKYGLAMKDYIRSQNETIDNVVSYAKEHLGCQPHEEIHVYKLVRIVKQVQKEEVIDFEEAPVPRKLHIEI